MNDEPSAGWPDEPTGEQPSIGPNSGGSIYGVGYPQSGNPQGAPQSGHPQSGHPQSGYPQGGYPRSGQPQGAQPQGAQPQGGYPQSGYPQGATAYGGGQPQGGTAYGGGYPQGGQPPGGYPPGGNPQGGYPRVGGHSQDAGYPPAPGGQYPQRGYPGDGGFRSGPGYQPGRVGPDGGALGRFPPGRGPRPDVIEDDQPGRGANRMKSIIVIAGAFVLVLLLGTVGWVLIRPDSRSAAAAPDPLTLPSVTTLATTTPPAVPTTTPPVPTTSPAKPAAKKAVPKPTVSVKPPAKEIPPAPKPVQPAPGCTGPTHTGTDAPMADVKAALLTAGHHQFWTAGNAPDNLKHALPAITVPDNLIKAFAWQESGWQSTILACDGGVGTMQLMPGTVDQINNRFNANLDVHTLSGNTMLGAAYIEWLTVYFGAYYFGENYDLSTVSPIGPSGEQYSLLQMVTAAYNVGPGTLEQPDGKSLSIPSGALHYSNNVIALMNNCPCSQY